MEKTGVKGWECKMPPTAVQSRDGSARLLDSP